MFPFLVAFVSVSKCVEMKEVVWLSQHAFLPRSEFLVLGVAQCPVCFDLGQINYNLRS